MAANRHLIFDVGLFDGADTDFYLAKGFSVVAIEARPDLVEAAQSRFSEALQSGRLAIVNRALWSEPDRKIPFYVRKDWSSVYRSAAERDGQATEGVIEVMTTTLGELFARFGVPHYLKIDIEGADAIALEQLAGEAEKPSFVSIEDPCGHLVPQLGACGYDRFQFSNQGLHRSRRQHRSREGKAAACKGHCSGLFGHDLRRSRWVDAGRLAEQIRGEALACDPRPANSQSKEIRTPALGQADGAGMAVWRRLA